MDNYQASHMGNNLVAMTTTPRTILQVTYAKISSTVDIIQESSMLKVGNPCLGMTSMQRKKKIAFDSASNP